MYVWHRNVLMYYSSTEDQLWILEITFVSICRFHAKASRCCIGFDCIRMKWNEMWNLLNFRLLLHTQNAMFFSSRFSFTFLFAVRIHTLTYVHTHLNALLSVVAKAVWFHCSKCTAQDIRILNFSDWWINFIRIYIP